jgi:hypothetical protein
MEKASNTNSKASFATHFVQKIIIVALLLLAVHTTLLAQLPERLIPLNVTALEAVDVTKLPKSDNPWDHWDKPDTTIRFTACKGDTSVIGYVLEDNIGIPFLLHFVHSDSAKSYHPTLKDVQRAEVLFAEVLNFRTDSANQVPRVFLAPYFYQYIRQYIFYLNKQNDTCVYINLVQFQRAKEYGVDRSFLLVHDGGDHYWHAKINLTKRQLLDYNINGPLVHVYNGRNSEPEGLYYKTLNCGDRYKYYSVERFNYREYPKAVERQLPPHHDNRGVSCVYHIKKGLRKYYSVKFGDGVTLTYRSNGKLISVATDDDVAGLSNEDLSLFPGADTLVNAIERDMRAIGRDFRKYGTIMWIEKIKGCYVIAAGYESPTPIYGMVAYYTFDRKGQISGVLRRWGRY